MNGAFMALGRSLHAPSGLVAGHAPNRCPTAQQMGQDNMRPANDGTSSVVPSPAVANSEGPSKAFGVPASQLTLCSRQLTSSGAPIVRVAIGKALGLLG